jgi:hypothetical protein
MEAVRQLKLLGRWTEAAGSADEMQALVKRVQNREPLIYGTACCIAIENYLALTGRVREALEVH